MANQGSAKASLGQAPEKSCLSAFAHAQPVETLSLMLPVPSSMPVSQLLGRCNQHYASLARPQPIHASSIFVKDVFEVVDHRQLVCECFSDFMEITVKAMLKPKVSAPGLVVAALTPVSLKQLPPGKKFTREPSTMADLIKTLPISDFSASKKQKTDEKLIAGTPKKSATKSPEKESKNARKKRERKELDKKLQASASKHRQSESLDSDAEDNKAKESSDDEPTPMNAFIRSISQSIQSYSIKEASEASSSNEKTLNVRGRNESCESSSSLSIAKHKRTSLDDLESSSDL